MPRQQLCGASERLALAWRRPVSHFGLGYQSERIVQETIRIILSDSFLRKGDWNLFLCVS